MNLIRLRPLCRAWCLALLFVTAGCGGTAASETSRTTGALHPPSTAPATPASTSSESPGTGSSVRLPPIVHRPLGLSPMQKVPLMIALYGAGMSPAGMQYLTGMNTIANRNGFVVAYLASSDPAHAWAPPSDSTYIHNTINQLIGIEHIDPHRVYVTGFSAGGYEAWRMGCLYSSQIAGIAIVANNMNQQLYNRCHLTRPESEYLLVGGDDSIRPTGIPGKLPGAPKTTARWRQLDGCSNLTTGPRTSGIITLQIWAPCVDGSAVALTYVGGGLHNWPGGPTISTVSDPYSKRYNASQAIWAFLSLHSLSPSNVAGSLLSANVTGGKRRTIQATLVLAESVDASATLSGRGRSWKFKAAHLRAGAAKQLRISVPASATGGRYSIKLKLVDSYGRRLMVSKSVQVPKP